MELPAQTILPSDRFRDMSPTSSSSLMVHTHCGYQNMKDPPQPIREPPEICRRLPPPPPFRCLISFS